MSDVNTSCLYICVTVSDGSIMQSCERTVDQWTSATSGQHRVPLAQWSFLEPTFVFHFCHPKK